MQSQPPVEFTDEIKSLFVEKKLVQARQRLLDTLSNQWDGHCNLIAFTYLYAENRSPDDCALALQWLEKGVALGEVDAKVILGRLLVSGELGSQDFSRGMDLLQQAAQANVLMAVLTLAQMYKGGVEGHLDADAQLTLQYLRQAADLGDAKLLACSMALDLMKITPDDLTLEFGPATGLTAFLSDAEDGRLLSF